MQVHVRTPHIKINIKGEISKDHLKLLKKEYGKLLEVDENVDDESIDVLETEWYKNTMKNMTPGKAMKAYRKNRGLTQEQLGELLGNLPKQHISNMENDIRPISLKNAKKLAKIFKTSVERFV